MTMHGQTHIKIRINTHHDIPQRNKSILRQLNPDRPDKNTTDEIWKPAYVESCDDK